MVDHDENTFLRNRIKELTGANDEMRRAIEDWATARFSDYHRADERAHDRLWKAYLRYCLTPQSRRQTGGDFLLPEDKESPKQTS